MSVTPPGGEHAAAAVVDRIPRHGKARAGAVATLLALACAGTASAADYAASVIASGLDNPRGLAFAPDGSLHVTEAGVASGSGPTTLVRGATYTFTHTGAVTRYDFVTGTQARVETGLASIYGGGDVSGPQGIAFGAGGTRYLAIGAGINPTVRATDLAPDGTQLARLYWGSGSADLGGWEATQNPAGGPLDTNPWHVAAIAGGVVVTDAGGNSLLKVADDGTISTLATFPSKPLGGPFGPSDPVPTGLAVGPDGAYYVGELTGVPFTPGASLIHRVPSGGGAPTVYADSFTQITGLAFGADGSLYVLEYDANGITVPGNEGALIRLAPDGTRTTIFSTGLVAPTGLVIGADGAFYVSNHGAESGVGEVLRIAVVPEPATWALMLGGLGVAGLAARRRRADDTTA